MGYKMVASVKHDYKIGFLSIPLIFLAFQVEKE